MLALLTKMAAYDQRTIGEADVAAWHEVLPEEVGIVDALASVPAHYSRSRDRMMPADVIDAVTAVRRERLQRAGTPPMPADLTWKQERTWRKLWCDNVKDGMSIELAAATASDEMDLPKELPPAPDAVADERKALIQKLAESKATPKPKPENFKPTKPRERWGCWYRGYVQPGENGADQIILSPHGTVLYHSGGPYGITVESLASDPQFWLQHISDKGWGDSATLVALARAWADITNATDDQRAQAIVWASEAIDPEREDESYPTPGHSATNRTEQQQ